MLRLSLAVLLALAGPGCAAEPEPDGRTRFAVVGHLRGFFEPGAFGVRPGLSLLSGLADAINEQQPDYVFVLGDLTKKPTHEQYARVRERFLDRLAAPHYIAPGNHDLFRGRKVHVARVGYLYTLVRDRHANFVLMNTMDKLPRARQRLEALFREAARDGPEKPTFLLAHHRIWLDEKIPGRRRLPPYPSSAIMPWVRLHAAAVFAGNSGMTFLADESHGIPVFSCGLGFPQPPHFQPIFFATATVDASGALAVEPVFVEVPGEHPWHPHHRFRARGAARP